MPYSGVRVGANESGDTAGALSGAFQLIILRQPVEAALLLVGGLTAVIVGLALFMEGLNVGLMPFGTLIGDKLPRKASMPVMLAIIAILGVGVTFAEPAIGALQAFGASVDVTRAPYLYEILNNWTCLLSVGRGRSRSRRRARHIAFCLWLVVKADDLYRGRFDSETTLVVYGNNDLRAI